MAGKSPAYVLDSFALLAYFQAEAGMSRVRALLSRAARQACAVHLSVINLGEVLYIVEREKGLSAAQQVVAAIDRLPVELVPATRAIVFAAAHVKARFPLSYADAFAVAVAHERHATVVTGDPEFASVAGIVRIDWLPQG